MAGDAAELIAMSSAAQTLRPRMRRWWPAPFILASIAFHAAMIGTWALSAVSGTTLLIALAFNHLYITFLGMWPRSQWLGQNMVRLPKPAVARGEVALTFDDGPDPVVTLEVLDLLDRYSAKASFFCVGKRVRAHPHIVAEIVRRGHSVENHSESHSSAFACFGARTLRREIESAQASIRDAGAREPLFFRAPMGLRNPFLDPVAVHLGLRYVSWTRRGFDTVSRNSAAVVRRLCRNLRAGDILVLHDSAQWGTAMPLVLRVLPEILERIHAAGFRSVSLPMALH